MRAAIYVRVSTDDQAKEGFSLDAQTRRLEAYCRARGWDVQDTYRDEGHSARGIDRPEYSRMMSNKGLWDVLLVLKMDRIHRNSVNFALMMDDLRSNGKEFNSMQEKFDTTTAMGRFVMDIMQRIAQLESEQIGERVKVGMREKAKGGRGMLGSGHPYGYMYYNDSLIVMEEEAKVVRTIFKLRGRGLSYNRIAEDLNSMGVPTKKGGTWKQQTVYNISRNPLYAGYVRWDGIVTKGVHPPIVGIEEFEGINGRLGP